MLEMQWQSKFECPQRRGDVTECLVVVFKTHSIVLKHSIFTLHFLKRRESSRSSNAPSFKHTMTSRCADWSSHGHGGRNNHGAIDDRPLNSLGMLEKIGHPCYKYLEWKQRCEILQFTTNYWPIAQGCSDKEAIEYWRDIAHLLEFDKVTWRHLILLVHQGIAGRACANKILWDLLARYAVMSHMDLNHKAMKMIGEFRRLIVRPPGKHRDAEHWTFERALQPMENHKDFAAEAVPEGPVIITGLSGEPLAPPHCWNDARGINIPKKKSAGWDANDNVKDSGVDRRRSRKHQSWKPRGMRRPFD